MRRMPRPSTRAASRPENGWVPIPWRWVTAALSRVRDLLEAQPPDRIVTVIGGLTIPLSEYLRTRSFELVVHSIDLSRATGIPTGLPEEALEAAAALAAGIAVSRGQGEDLLLALTGRTPLPEGFSVV